MIAVGEDLPILYTDLVALRDLLNTLANQHLAQDMVDQYRKLDNRARRSPLTIAIADALSTLEAYIEDRETEDEDSDRA